MRRLGSRGGLARCSAWPRPRHEPAELGILVLQPGERVVEVGNEVLARPPDQLRREEVRSDLGELTRRPTSPLARQVARNASSGSSAMVPGDGSAAPRSRGATAP